MTGFFSLNSLQSTMERFPVNPKLNPAKLTERASVSVMPLYLYKRLDLNKLTPTKISLQMADKINCHTYRYL